MFFCPSAFYSLYFNNFFCIFSFIIFDHSASSASAQIYHAFQDPVYQEFGLVDESNNQPCLYMKFHAKLYNFNLNGTDIGTEMADFTSDSVKLHGFCALHNEVKKNSQLQASWKSGKRRRTLKFMFKEGYLEETVSIHQAQELRWLLDKVVYSEHFNGRSVSFSSSNNSAAIKISAPLNQKFVCKDKLNISLHNPKYQDIVVEFLPEIDIQPVNTHAGFGSNRLMALLKACLLVYLCERTKGRTLSESFQSTMTIFAGFVLGFSSVSVLAGYSLRRMFKKTEKNPQQFYDSF